MSLGSPCVGSISRSLDIVKPTLGPMPERLRIVAKNGSSNVGRMTMNLTARNHFYQYQNPFHQLKPFDIEAVPIIAHRILQLAGQTYKFNSS